MSGFWKILGLEPTRDVSAIRRAYAQKAKSCHPEENPEDFLELRKAYQAAMKYVEQGEDEPEEDTHCSASKESPETAAGWSIRKEAPEEERNPFRDGEAIRQFVNLYAGKQRRNSKLWLDYFTSDVFLDAAWDSRFTDLLREKITEMAQDLPPSGELLMWLEIVYQFSIEELEHDRETLQAYPRPKRPGGDELAIQESFKDYQHLTRLARSGVWNEQAMEEFKWIAGRYVSAYLKDKCDPKGNPDYQRHPAGLQVFIHFFRSWQLPEELYHIVWRKYDLKNAVMGRGKVFYGPLRELVTERVSGIEREDMENFFRLNQDRKICFARIQANPEQEEGELDAFFAREDVQKVLRSRRFVEEQLLSCSDWLNSLTPKGAVDRLAEFYEKNQDIPGWNRVVDQAKRELECRAKEQEQNEEQEQAEEPEVASGKLDLSLLLTFPDRVYVQPLTGLERLFKPDKGNYQTTSEEGELEDLPDEFWSDPLEDEEEENAEPLTREDLLTLFGWFAGGGLERLELVFGQNTLVLTHDKDSYACFYFESGCDTWFSLLSQPEIYATVDSEDVRYLPFGMGKLADYNIHKSPDSILDVLNLVFMQIGRGRIEVRMGNRWLWSSHTSMQNGQFRKHMAMQKLAKIPAGRMSGHILAKFVFSRYPACVESITLSGERNLTRLKSGTYNLAADALAQFFQQKLARLRLSWESQGQKDETDQRHIILLQDGGQFMMAWLEDGRERASFYASDVPGIFLGRVYPACLVHQNLNRIRNCLDLILEDMSCANLVTDRVGEFVPADRPYTQIRTELVNEKQE